ncbi:PAS domain S-box protein [Actinoplanes sp. NPDC051851]|uniref:sensor histidine kinase n=1 Tax=Actinoplanes sp. NPDC051851 TaxID=3154753 RepID=UPI00344AC79B
MSAGPVELLQDPPLLAAAFACSPAAKAVIDADGLLTEVNDAFCALLGYARAELLGAAQPQLTEGALAERELTRRDGSRVWVSGHAVRVEDRGGRPYLVVEITDMTEAVAARRETDRLRTTIGVQREITAVAGDRAAVLRMMAGRTLEVLPAGDSAAVRLVDADGGSLRLVAGTGRLADRALPPLPLCGNFAALAVAERVTLRSDDTEDDPRVDRAMARFAGTRSLVVAPLQAAGGDPFGVLIVGSRRPGAFDEGDEHQLTLLADALSGALRHAEETAIRQELLARATAAVQALEHERATVLDAMERLAQSEQGFAEVFDHSPIAKMVMGLREPDLGRITLANPAFGRLFGYPAAATATLRVADLIGGDSPELDAALDDLASGRRHRGEREVVLRHRDGTPLTITAHTSVISDELGPATAVVQLLDVTTVRATERAIAERTAALEAANHLKSDLIGMLGHEIGNPLTAIRGHAEILADDWRELDDARRSRAIEAILRQTGRLDNIAHEVLTMVTVEAGTIRADRRRLDLRTEIGHALAAADAEELPVHGGDAAVLFQAGHLQQILVNLLSNAAKYGGGAIAIRIAERDGRVLVTVEDGGAGVPEDFRDLLFDRLARADRDAATVQGTGLGLYIVRGLAHANQGDIRYEPNPGGGSRFILEAENAENAEKGNSASR